MKRNIFFLIAAFMAGALVGASAYNFYYTDVCLDLGGGKNPGNYPVCVIEK